MTTDRSCIFCRITDGAAPAHIVWSDAEHVALSEPDLRAAADRLRVALAT